MDKVLTNLNLMDQVEVEAVVNLQYLLLAQLFVMLLMHIVTVRVDHLEVMAVLMVTLVVKAVAEVLLEVLLENILN